LLWLTIHVLDQLSGRGTRGLATDIHMHVVELRTGWVVKLSHLSLFSHIAGE
jgi:hypothetical protein